MQIGGFVKNSFVDYPGLISCCVFVVGCNFNCWYCHNSHLLKDNNTLIDEKTIFEFLSSHKSFIDAVVVSGGEPTLQKDLKEFLQKIKVLNYKIKLDTNGSDYKVLKDIVESGLVDYVAMDIKAPLTKYKDIVCQNIDVTNVHMSISYLLNSKIDYEFRTTFSSDLTVDDIKQIINTIQGAKNYSLQKCRVEFLNKNVGEAKLKTKLGLKEHGKQEVDELLIFAKNKVKNFVVKGFA
ncbi:MAG: anaerobic ribonucleoside-triphosphate reductase activating protein [Clostridia bacterium]|nr:anaerobic ribonucleoside-triphosphate reductase activating protein [Clostridia bacterium]